MDNPETINCVEWFFGYGGNHLGLKRVLPNLRCIAACEIEAYAIANMVAKIEAGCLDPFPIWSNVKTFPCEQFLGLVDIFAASYPCQGFSSAGERKGQADHRFLWPWVLQGIISFQPRLCFFENVDGHVSLGLSTVISDLEAAGYRTTWGVFSAAEVGAPQSRKRVFIMAVHKGQRGRETAARFQSSVSVLVASGENGMGNDMLKQANGNNATGFHNQPARTSEAMGDSKGERFRKAGKDCGQSEEWVTKPGELADSESCDRYAEQRKQCEERTEKLQGGIGMANATGEEFGAGQGDNGTGRKEIGSNSCGNELANTKCDRCGTLHDQHAGEPSKHADGSGIGIDADAENTRRKKWGGELCNPFFWPEFVARPGEKQREWEPKRVIELKRGLGGGVNGRSSNVDRLRLLGNGVYPAVAMKAFVTLIKRLT